MLLRNSEYSCKKRKCEMSRPEGKIAKITGPPVQTWLGNPEGEHLLNTPISYTHTHTNNYLFYTLFLIGHQAQWAATFPTAWQGVFTHIFF
jgi:hypothetical protein